MLEPAIVLKAVGHEVETITQPPRDTLAETMPKVVGQVFAELGNEAVNVAPPVHEPPN